MEGRILLRFRASTSQEMDEDTLVGILMVFMLGNTCREVRGWIFAGARLRTG